MNEKSLVYNNRMVKLHSSMPLYSEEYTCIKDTNFEKHAHEFFEIGITLGGYARHRYEAGSESLRRGSVYLIPIGQSHSVTDVDKWHVQNLYFIPTLAFLTRQNPLIGSSLFSRFFMTLLNNKTDLVLHLQLDSSSTKEIERIIASYKSINLSNETMSNQFKMNCMLNLLLILCDAYYRQVDVTPALLDDRIPNILQIIQSNLHLPSSDTISLIASSLSLHPQYINKLVKSSLGITLSKLILEAKIKHSCELLLSDIPITGIAHRLGFFDHAHYHKCFVGYFGISPSNFIKKQHSML